ncbi:MAG TPA: glycosyltransferase family 4 protein [Gemmatimonadales bacterium]|nr:glycosyltransferase family 4 protein [Gemmatimonadales bacterium]
MRILTLCYEFPPLGGGGSRVAHGLARELVRLGHQVDVITMGRPHLPRFSDEGGVGLHRVRCVRRADAVCTGPEAFSYVLAALPKALELVRQGRYDLNHTHFIFPDGVIAWLLWRIARLPYVITAHGSDVPGFNPHRLQRAHRILAPAWRAVVRDAAALVSPSETLRSLILRQRGAPEPILIPNGIDTDRFSSAEPGTRILVVSKLFERKGIQLLLRALRGVPLDGPISIVGDGPYLPALTALAGETGVPAKFWGWLDNASPELAALYQESGIFVLPSQSENFPVVLLEAMAAGLAIITTQGTGCAEVVGDAALLVPPNDVPALREALRRLLGDPALRAALGAAGRRRVVERFGWPVIAARYLELFQRYAAVPNAARV